MNGIEGLGGAGRPAEPLSAEASGGTSFGGTLRDLISDTDRMQHEAKDAVEGFVRGDVADVHDVMIAMTRADVSFRLMLEVRNKLVEAYQEVMRMQV